MAFDGSLSSSVKFAVHQLIEQQAAQNPQAVAIVFEQQQMTYGELNRRANQLAAHLQSLGVGPGRLVSLCVERSLEMFVALVGVLKSGGTYIPLDPAYPSDRLEFMMEDSQSSVLLTHRNLDEQLQTTPALQRVYLDRDAEIIAQYSDANLDVELSGDDRAYIIYTSGSTGKPKGVQIKHSALVNLLRSMQREPGLEAQDTLLAMTTISFDLAVPDLYLPLIAGAKIRLISREVATNPAQLSAVLSEPDITFVQATPATWRMVLASGWSGNPNLKILCGGEALTRALANQLLDRVASLWHMYGPTETTVWSMVHQVLPGNDVVPLGRPIANTQIYLLENQTRRQEDALTTVPVGVTGELFIGGDGVALGYLNRDELNAERFIPDTFSREPGAYLYKTGDLARYRPDGNLEFIGRADNQVKIRGYRVELGDVEMAIAQHPTVRETAVLAKEDATGNKSLVAYVVARSEADQIDNLSEAYSDQIEQWGNVWSGAYAEITETEFDSNGWNDSFTGKPMPADEVQVWLDQTVDRILALKPKRILEIGCGMGMLLFRIAPECEAYVGTDISAEGLQNIQRQLDQNPEQWSHVHMAQVAAHELDRFEPGSFDTIVINSVIQYFPSVDYLANVLKKLTTLVSPGGHIFVGDIRNLNLLETFHTGVQSGFAADNLSTEALRARVQQRIEQERELVIRPEFFEALQQQIPSISYVDTQLKRGYAHNELIRFRSDVTLCIEQAIPTLEALSQQNWSELSLESLYEQMKEGAIEALKITDVLDPRIASEVQITEWLAENHENMTVRDLRQVTTPALHYAHPEDFWQLADEMGYGISVMWPESKLPGRYDVVIQKGYQNLAIAPSPQEAQDWQSYANNPSKSNNLNQFVPQLRSFLTEALPSHMMPSYFVVLDTLPLTPNGKVDRRALPEPKKDRPTLASDYLAPTSTLETNLASIWSQVLGIDCVGIRDNFFELGGHSLLTAQLLQNVEAIVGVEIPLFYLLKEPTIEGMVKAIATIQRIGGEETADDVAEAIDWQAETQLDPAIVPEGEFVFTSTPQSVLITGATGFLGAFLLQELLQSTTADIYCLVRAQNIAEATYKLQANLERYGIWNGALPSRVLPLLGDLARPRLGLTEEAFQGLALKLDGIYHNGAFINLVYPYNAMRAANVLGTQELLRLACRGKVTPLHFVSTIDIFQSPHYFDRDQILETPALNDPDALGQGYPQTKWVAEKLVMAAKERGLPVAIYRPGMLTGHSQTGAAQTGDLLCRIIKGLVQMEVAPEMNAWINMTPVDYASRSIVHLSKQMGTFGKCFHVVNPVAVPWNYLLHEIRMAGYPLQSIAPADWKSLLIDWPNNWENALMPMRGLFVEDKPESGMTYLEAFLLTATAFDCQNLLTALEGSGIECPTVDARLMRTYFNAFQRSGFLPASQLDQQVKPASLSPVSTIPSVVADRDSITV